MPDHDPASPGDLHVQARRRRSVPGARMGHGCRAAERSGWLRGERCRRQPGGLAALRSGSHRRARRLRVYKPGQVARLVVQTPFAQAQGLLTLEREGVIEARLFRIDGNTPTLDVPITAAHAPNVFAGVVLLRGRVHHDKDATGFETGAPAFKIGYATLAVEAPKATPCAGVGGARRGQPGEKLAIKVSAKDVAGTVRPAQATLMVVDEAVLGLTGHKTPEPLSQIYAERPLGVRTGESRLDLPFARRSRHEQIFPGGDGGEGDGDDDSAHAK